MNEGNEDQESEGPGIGLADMIMSLRSELLRAQQDPDIARLPLITGPVELQLSVAITKAAHAKTGIRFWVLDAGGGIEQSGLTTQSFKIVLNPIDPKTGEAAKVASGDAKSAFDE